MRTLEHTASIGLRTGKTVRVRPSVTLKRYIRNWFQPKCATETNCDARSIPLSVSFTKSKQKLLPHSCGLPSISTESLHGSAQRRIKVLIFHTSYTLWTRQQNSTMALRHSAQARSQERLSENLVGRAYTHC